MDLKEMYKELKVTDSVFTYCERIEQDLKARFEQIDKVAEYNQLKVLKAMQKNKVSDIHFAATTGYGYNDLGREVLESVYADTFHAEAALVRPQLTCGTHALTIALAANLRPGDELLSPVGKPYDTLEGVIGIGDNNTPGCLKEYGVSYRQVDLLEDGAFDWEEIKKAITPKTKLITIQRSKGYQTRPTLSVARIGELISFVKKIKPDVICMVDNCYGEFVEELEPTDVGADMCVGSLIKNLGGAITSNGGYIVGREDLINLCAERLNVPGQALEVGPSLNQNRYILEGLYFAPMVVANAIKTAIYTSYVMERLGYEVSPKYNSERVDIVFSLILK